MASVFIPPAAPRVPTTVNPSHPGSSLFRHYRPWDAGTNVWLMPGGVVTTVEPEFESDAVRVFHGGHIHPVDSVEAAALVAAGYAVVDLVLPAPTPPLPGFDDVEGKTVLGPGEYGYAEYGYFGYGGVQ